MRIWERAKGSKRTCTTDLGGRARTGYLLPYRLTLPHLVTVRGTFQRNMAWKASRSSTLRWSLGSPCWKRSSGAWPVEEWMRVLYSHSAQAQKALLSSSRVFMPAREASLWNSFLIVLFMASTFYANSPFLALWVVEEQG